MGVAEGRVGEEQPVLVTHPAGEALGAELLEEPARARIEDGAALGGGHRRRGEGPGLRMAGDGRVAVDQHLPDEGEQPGTPVLAGREVEELGGLVDEPGRDVAGQEGRVGDQGVEEEEVRLDPADPVLPQRPAHPRDHLLRRRRPGGDLLEQRVVGRGDHGADVGGPPVEADAEAGRLALGDDPPVVGDELVLRVLGRHPALQGVAAQPDVRLGGDPALRRADAGALGQADLRLDEVDPGDHLGDRVLDLDPRVDLDEEEPAGVDVLEELDRPGVAVPGLGRQAHGGLAELLARGRVEGRRRRPLDDLLVAALDRAVALEEVDDLPGRVGQDLDLEVAGPLDQTLEEDIVAPERRPGLAARRRHLLDELRRVVNHAHAAPATPPARLDHHRKAHLGAQPLDLAVVVGERSRGGHHRHPGLLGDRPGRDLVAQPFHHRHRRADPRDRGLGAGGGEVRVLREEAVARVDRVDADLGGQADDLLDPQVGLDRLLAPADEVALVGLEPVQGEPILARVDGHRLEPELGRGPEDANRDLTAVGHQQLADLPRHRPASIRRSPRAHGPLGPPRRRSCLSGR